MFITSLSLHHLNINFELPLNWIKISLLEAWFSRSCYEIFLPSAVFSGLFYYAKGLWIFLFHRELLEWMVSSLNFTGNYYHLRQIEFSILDSGFWITNVFLHWITLLPRDWFSELFLLVENCTGVIVKFYCFTVNYHHLRQFEFWIFLFWIFGLQTCSCTDLHFRHVTDE